MDDNMKRGLACCGLIVIIALVAFMITGNNTTHENTTEKTHVMITELEYDREGGILVDSNLYGWIDGKLDNGTNGTFYVTNNQMASLYYGNGKSFNYSDGILLTYHFDSSKGMAGGANIVDHIYYSNGTEIPSVSSEMADKFGAESLAINDSVCSEYFGMTNNETVMYDSLKK